MILLLVSAGLLMATGARAEDFDRTVRVAPGTTLDLRLYGGTVTVRGWDRDAVRTRATHFRTDAIDVRTAGAAVVVRAQARLGRPHAIDFDIDVPTWMSVAITGTYLDITVAGTRASVTAETVRGDVRVTGGAGTLTLKSIEGQVSLEGGEGRADLVAVNNGVRVNGWKGDLLVETVNGGVTMRGVQSTAVEVGTVGGDVSWNGSMSDQGRYQFATHNGDIDVALSEGDNAAVSVRAFEGRFSSAFPVKMPDARALRRRYTFVLGTGAAHLDLETFGGTISLRRGLQAR